MPKILPPGGCYFLQAGHCQTAEVTKYYYTTDRDEQWKIIRVGAKPGKHVNNLRKCHQ